VILLCRRRLRDSTSERRDSKEILIGFEGNMKTTLETSGEDKKTTLETSGEDKKNTLETGGEDVNTILITQIFFVRKILNIKLI
jgi:hypothetical protein